MKSPKEVIEEIGQLRQELHQFPELSGAEYQTARRITEMMKDCGTSQILDGLGGHGVAVTFDSEKKGSHVMVRCELDALPIHEINHMSYRSKVDHVSHKCGHDGHMSILYGLGLNLQHRPIPNGKVTLLFQPAEENGEGAREVLEDPKFASVRPDYVVALHNQPGLPFHQIQCRPGTFTPAVISLIIRMEGRTSHAAEPHKGINPALALSELVQGAKRLEKPDENKDDFSLVTPVFMHMGDKAYGISAGEGEIHFTIRTWTNEALDTLLERTSETAQEVARKWGLKCTMETLQHFKSVNNNERVFQVIRKSAIRLGMAFAWREKPMPWGEDFGLLTEHIPGAMFVLGAGSDTPALHNPDYDFPDNISDTGINLFRAIIDELIGK